MQSGLTYAFAGGGTGGHLFPGVAVAAELQQRDPATQIAFLGTDRSVEQQIVSRHGFEHVALPSESAASLRRNPLKFLWRNGQAYRAAKTWLLKRSPVAVIGLGSYASVPVVVAASSLNIPVMLLEQNAIAGRATRWLSSRASVICLTYEQTEGKLSKNARIVVTGNPVRREISALTQSEKMLRQDRRKTLLILGGSQGATILNQSIPITCSRLAAQFKDWRIVHQSGTRDAVAVGEQYRRIGCDAVVSAFFDDITERYRRADLVISRSGATTLAELACAGCPAVLVPFPQSADGHQLANARWHEKSGGAVVVEQVSTADATAERFVDQVQPLLLDSARRSAMSTQMRSLARPAAAQDVANQLAQIVLRKGLSA